MRSNSLTLLVCSLAVAACGDITQPFHDAAIPDVTLTVTKSSNGGGTITSTPDGINCGATCTMTVPAGTMVTLSVAPDADSDFTGWSGNCSGAMPTCTVTVGDNITVGAAFSKKQFTVSVTSSGNGTGSVVSSPSGITCQGGAGCSAKFDIGTAVTLTATADVSSTFGTFTGGNCTSSPCTITVNADTSVDASFTLQTFALTVQDTGNGTGTVTSGDNLINCGSMCSQIYNYGTSVVLTATPTTGSDFIGWSGGGCSGTGTCTTTITGATNVTAMFMLHTFSLTVGPDANGNGMGTITSSDGNISCGANCTANYMFGATVVLTATPANGSTFTGWQGGGCSGTGTCTVTISADTTVTATFTLKTFTLTAAKNGNGSGTVTSTDNAIQCGTTCSKVYNFGTMVTLNAVANTGSTFTGWSGGGCSGTGSCTTTVTAATTVTATFALQTFNLTLASNGGNGAGTVAPSPVGTSCGAGCFSYNFNTVVSITATPNTGSTFTTFAGGGCTTTNPCSVTMSANTSVTATFTLQKFNLTTATNGNGQGSVSVSPTGTSCGANCNQYDFGTVVSVTATPQNGSSFTTFAGGSCSTTNPCSVTVSANTTVTATFTLKSFALNITKSGGGTGTVTSAPAGLNCGPNCTANFNFGTSVTLTAAPGPASFIALWTGAPGCSTGNTCTVTVNGTTTVDVTFTAPITWDPTFPAPGVTFTNGNHSISGNSAGTKNVRTTVGKSAGKWYYEIAATGGNGGTTNDGGIGIADPNWPSNSSFIGGSPSSLGFGYGAGNTTVWWQSWTGAVTGPVPPANSAINTGTTYLFALDMDNGKLWIGTHIATTCSWFSGDPNATPPTGPSFSAFTPSTVFPAVTFYPNSINAFTADFGGNPFVCPVPTGFNPGFYKTAGLPTDLGSTETWSANFLHGQKVAIAQTSTLIRLGFLSKTGAGSQAYIALYADNAGEPGALIVSTGNFNVVTGFNEIVVPATTLVTGSYWIMVNSPAAVGFGADLTSGLNIEHYVALPFASGPPNPFPAPSTTFPNNRDNFYMVVAQ